MFFSWNVAADICSAALGMSHLAEDPAAGAGDPLDGEERSIGIMTNIHRGIAFQVAVLGGDLASGGQFLDLFRGGVEFPFPMRDRDTVQVIDAALGEPWGEVGGNAGGHIAGHVTSDVIEGQGGGASLWVANLSEGNEAGLDQGLEPIADAKDEAIPSRDKLHHGISHHGATQNGGNEFSRAIGLSLIHI